MPVADLHLGHEANPGAVPLPPCPECGAVEHLLRTLDACPERLHGTRFDMHRRAVNGLADELLAAGRHHTSAAPQGAAPDLPPTSGPVLVGAG